MKVRTINSILCKKFDAWMETIKDPAVKALVKDNTICTGGAIASMLLNEPINDFDFYFRNYDTCKAVALYYVEKFKAAHNSTKHGDGKETEIYVETVEDSEDKSKFRVRVIVKSAGVASEQGDEGYKYFESQPDGEAAEYLAKVMDGDAEIQSPEKEKAKTEKQEEAVKKEKYRPVFLSANAISLSDDVQLVIRFYGEPSEIHANYDFVHVTQWWDSSKRTVNLKQDALLSLMNRDLRYIGSRYPLCSLFRTRKFIQRGWKITAGQILKIAVNLQRYNLLDVGVLEEALTGVDVAYFHDLIDRIKKEEAAKGTTPDEAINSGKFSVDESYLAQLVDRLF